MIRTVFPSQLLEQAVNEFNKLPGIGRKTALKLVLSLLKREAAEVNRFADAIKTVRNDIKYCKVCHNICDDDVCEICNDPNRDHHTICVVENIQDVMAIENTQQYNGIYHVLGGLISPMDGVRPADLSIGSLIDRVSHSQVKEIIFALSSTMEGDTTIFYIGRQLEPYHIRTSVIARGISVGDELEYTDEVTLGRSIINRTEYK